MTDRLTQIAKSLRRKQTEEERKLWAKLRDRRLNGLKFRRQAPCGPYVADFLCEEARLIVELDGSQHADTSKMQKDAERSRMLQELGYDVLRVWNADIKDNLDNVLGAIVNTASKRTYGPSSAPPGHLLPMGEGNNRKSRAKRSRENR